MLPIDDTDWLEDFRIKLSENEIREYVGAIAETLVFDKPKSAVAGWLSLAGVAGSSSGGMVASSLMSAWSALLVEFIALAAGWWSMRSLTRLLFGPAIQWQAVSLFFFTSFIGAGAVWAGGFTSKWWAYGVSAAIGGLFGLVYGSLDPTSITNKEAWALASLPLGPLSAVAATYVLRHMSGPANVAQAAIAAGIGGLIFAAPMMVLLVRLWDNARGWRHLVSIYLHHDTFLRTAIEYADKALVKTPDDPFLLHMRALAHFRSGDLPRAEADWQRISELDPQNAEPARMRGDVLLNRRAGPQAIAALEAAAAQHPDHAQTHVSLGLAVAESGDLQRAIQHFDRAVSLEPRRPSSHVCRAQVLLKTGAAERAIADCDAALQIIHSFALAYMVRGRAYALLGEHDRAAEDYQDALASAPDSETANEAQEALDALRTTPDD
jgi:Tfp pilus assembly protein PilF